MPRSHRRFGTKKDGKKKTGEPAAIISSSARSSGPLHRRKACLKHDRLTRNYREVLKGLSSGEGEKRHTKIMARAPFNGHQGRATSVKTWVVARDFKGRPARFPGAAWALTTGPALLRGGGPSMQNSFLLRKKGPPQNVGNLGDVVQGERQGQSRAICPAITWIRKGNRRKKAALRPITFKLLERRKATARRRGAPEKLHRGGQEQAGQARRACAKCRL